MDWEIVIGLETHAQLSTVSKIFSGTSTRFGAAPNTQASAIDLALPGVLPVLNRGAVERAICFGLAVDAKIASHSIFARKNYFYPDLPKGYQISQYDMPIVEHGHLTIQVSQSSSIDKNQPHDYEKTIHILRAHLEEDAGKLLHEEFAGMTGVDLNRAGTPLLEIVTNPDMRSAAEAVAYAKALHTLVVWLGICDGNMQEGSFRCDANVSVRPVGQQELGTRTEIKNLNSFRFLDEAIRYEARRQIQLIEEGGRVTQETRLYDPNRRETRSMRSKEDAHDYRYFSDPDLLPLVVSPEWVEQVRSTLPELPAAMSERFINAYELSPYDAHQLTTSRVLADYYEAAVKKMGTQHAKALANWMTGELAAQLKRHELTIEACPVTPAQLARLLMHIVNGSISNKIAKEVFQAMWDEKALDEAAADRIIEAQGLQQISGAGELEAIIDQVLAANPKSVEEFHAGKQKAFNALVGQVMKATQGKANPQQVNACLQQKLDERKPV